jgi:ribosome-binding factor A
MRRVNEALREVLSTRILGLKDPRIGFVTVTAVDTSADLRHASVFVSVLGGEPSCTTSRSTAGSGSRSCSKATTVERGHLRSR